MSEKLNSISISGRLTLNMHSLNNEGNEGNQVLTRQATIVDQNGNAATVTAVSGDMLKHIMCEHFWNIAKEEKLSLSATSQTFNANRIIASDIKKKKGDTQSDITDDILKTCAMCDIAGAMVTELGNFSRKSVAEFGWLLALPDTNQTENFFHAKYVTDAKAKKEEADIEGEEGDDKKAGNIGQNIFHRPANSGVYAFVGNFEISRLSYNDIAKTYPLSDDEREKRFKALLKSILYTFIKPNGAMRNTQNPHILNFEGVIATSSSTCPAPTVSALNKSYIEEMTITKENLNKITNNSINCIEFKSLSEFSGEMAGLILNKKPYKL
jgi:CRISPR-associated protein Cst2